MSVLFSRRWLYITTALVVVGLVFLMIAKVSFHEASELITATVDRGVVRQLVSVSGVAEALQSAKLAFPTSGTVSKVLVKKGDVVAAGDPLIVLDLSALLADRKDAAASLVRAVADRDALLSGPTATTREVTSETVSAKELALATTKETEVRKIDNAYRALLSDDLAARSEDPNEEAIPPTVSGTYACDREGSYTITVYSSAANSGYSYTLSGLESGTYTASTDQPTPMGTCGLYLLFDTDSEYRRSNWTIDIPNTAAASYTGNKNAFELAKDNASAFIKTAEQALTLARADASNQNAPARSEDIRKADAAITQARARLERIDASLADLSLTAPFAGTITELDILPGETVTTAPIVTLLTDSAFEVVARIPEIDIGKIAVGQKAELLFDAKEDEVLKGEIRFISLEATEIDGVAYYKAYITLDTLPPWMRSDLNSDIDIIISEMIDVLRIPKRFVIKTDDGHTVLMPAIKTGTWSSTTVEVLLEGNDGFVAITGTKEGDTLIAP